MLSDLALSHSPHLTPELSAAVLRALALVPGVELAGEGDTLLGDRGVVVRRVDDGEGSRRDVVLDPATGRSSASGRGYLQRARPGRAAREASRPAVVGAFGERP
jgi:RNA polymerase sigma-70 factor (ECF subfamily)